MTEQNVSPLCCCEYVDKNQERNHILGFCCNCVDLDDGFDSLVSGKGFPQENKSLVMATFQDRLRIPWRGGAKQVAFDTILPVIILPVMFLIAACSFWWTIFSFTAVIVILSSIFRFLIRTIPRTKFFFVWTVTSIIILYVIFELLVIPMLQILLEENLLLSILIGLFLWCLYLTKVRTTQLTRLGGPEAEMGDVGAGNNRCFICQVVVPQRDHHCVWFDCCIGRHNQCVFILSLLFAVMALLYGSNLILTSVCHPFTLYKSILLPDDCADAYQEIELSLSFVIAIYCLGLATMLFILLIHQILLVSMGLSNREWRKLTCWQKMCLGLCSRRINNLGFFRNWARIMCWDKGHYAASNIYNH